MSAASQADMAGKLCLVSGGTSGIGRAAAAGLAARGARVGVIARSEARGREACAAIRSGLPESAGEVEVFVADLASLSQTRALCAEVGARWGRLDVLVCSAGVISTPRRESEDGVELNFAVAYLSAFALIRGLEALLRAAAPARVVIVSGEFHRKFELDWDDLQTRRRYNALRAGSRAALAKVVLTCELARRWEAEQVAVNCLHPGGVRTGLTRGLPLPLRALLALARPFQRTPEEGAATALALACEARFAGQSGGYYIDERLVAPSAFASDPESGRRLWEASEALLHSGGAR